MPERYKSYPSASRIALKPPDVDRGPPLFEAMRNRRSIRDYVSTPITKEALSQLLWASQGITEGRHGLRTAPSAGALYPIETYLVVHRADEVPPGIYHYSVPRHELEQLEAGDFRAAIAEAALEQEMASEAGVVFVWSAIFARSKWKYRERAYRYVYLDAGHIAQNTALAATALGLGSCQIGALYDDEVNRLLHLDGVEESVVYMTAVGRCR
jgi:SagB-type dehydrogenase family enzyme